jgi:hypothetical protein
VQDAVHQDLAAGLIGGPINVDCMMVFPDSNLESMCRHDVCPG